MIEIRPARAEELDVVWLLVRRAVAHMNELGNPQWGEDYPTRDFYADDLARGELYAARSGGVLAGAACINTAEAPEYAPLPWATAPPAVVIHRMAVDPAFQRQGVGRASSSAKAKKARPTPCVSTRTVSTSACRRSFSAGGLPKWARSVSTAGRCLTPALKKP